MDKRGNERIGLVFLHDAGSSGSDISSFFSSIPLESFGDKSFQEVCDILRIQVITPTAQVRSDTDDAVDSSIFWEWFAVSPDWQLLGLENTVKEDRESIDLSKNQLHELLIDVERRCEYIFIGGFAHGGNMCLELLNENHPGIFQSSGEVNNMKCSSLQRAHPKVIGVFTIASFLPTSSSVLSHTYENISNESKSDNKEIESPLSVLMLHGKDDTTVSCEWGRITASHLTLHQKLDVRFQHFPDTEHEIGENELHVLLDWIEATVNASKKSIADGILFDYEDSKSESTGKKDVSSQFQIEPLTSQGPNAYCITYPAEPDVVHALTGRPVLACGGMFDITEARNGVQCIVHSSDPEKTAVAIGERLVARIASHIDGTGNAGEDVCTVS